MDRCWSCQAFIGDEAESEEGLSCPNCYDEAPAADLRMNGWEWDGSEWKRS